MAYIPPNAYTITDEQIRGIQQLELCRHCECQLLASQHHNELDENYHLHDPIDVSFFEFALSGDYPYLEEQARARCAEAINARRAKSVT